MDIIRFIYCNNFKMGTYKLIHGNGRYLWFHIGRQSYDDYPRLNKLRTEAFDYKYRSAYRFYETDLVE